MSEFPAWILVILLLLAGIEVVAWIVYQMQYAGQGKPLRVKGKVPSGATPAEMERGARLHRPSWTGSYSFRFDELLHSLALEGCPFHSKPTIGIAVLFFFKRRLSIYRMLQGPGELGIMSIAICEECIPIVTSLRIEAFKWTRENYMQQPEWGSAQILPHLLKANSAFFCGILLKEEKVGGDYQEPPNPQCKPKNMDDSERLQLPLTRLIREYAECTSARDLVEEPIPAKKLMRRMRSFAAGAGEERPLFLMKTVLLTDKRIHFGYDPSKTMAWADIEKAGLLCQPHLGFSSKDHIFHNFGQASVLFINREPIGGHLRPELDYLVNLLKDIARRNLR